jgi:hypothetical protein
MKLKQRKEPVHVQPSEYSTTEEQVIRACPSLFNNGGLEELTGPFSKVASVTPTKASYQVEFYIFGESELLKHLKEE